MVYPEIAKLLNNTLPGALTVFTGLLPLLGVIAWFAFQQGDRFKGMNDRMDRLEGRLDRLESRMDRLEAKLDKLTEAVTALVIEVRTLNIRVAALEARDNQPRVLQS